MNKIRNHVELLMISDKLMLVTFFYIHVYAKTNKKHRYLIWFEIDVIYYKFFIVEIMSSNCAWYSCQTFTQGDSLDFNVEQINQCDSVALFFSLLILLFIYHIETQGHRFSTFRYIRRTIDTIVKCIISLLITGCITTTKHDLSV